MIKTQLAKNYRARTAEDLVGQVGTLPAGYYANRIRTAGPLLSLLNGEGFEDENGQKTIIGSSVDRWRDQSGNDFQITAQNPAKRGIATANGLFLDAIDDGYISNLNLVRPYTIFVVEQLRGLGGARTITSASTNSLISASRPYNSAYVQGDVAHYGLIDNNVHLLQLSVSAGQESKYFFDLVDVSLSVGTGSGDWGVVVIGSESPFQEPAITTLRDLVILPTRDEARCAIVKNALIQKNELFQ